MAGHLGIIVPTLCLWCKSASMSTGACICSTDCGRGWCPASFAEDDVVPIPTFQKED
jgi:hypothetical protein